MDIKEYYKNEGRIVFNKLQWGTEVKTYGDIILIVIGKIYVELYDIEKDKLVIAGKKIICDNIGMTFKHNNIEYDVHMKASLNDLIFNDINELSSFTILLDINLITTNNPDYVVISLNKDASVGVTSNPVVNYRFYMFCNGKRFYNDIITKKCILDNNSSMTNVQNIKYYSNGKTGKKYF